MNFIKNAAAYIAGGKRGSVKAEESVIGNIHACRVWADCPDGFDGDLCIVVRPDTEGLDGEYVAIDNHSEFWCRPFFGSDLSLLPERTQELLIKTDRGYFCCLPVCADTFKTLMRGGGDGLELYLYTGLDGMTSCDGQLSFVCGEGQDPHELLRDCAATAAKLLGNRLKMRDERKYPEPLERIGWCSWDAFKIWVGEDGLTEKAKEFVDKGLPIGFAIIDDMWAEIDGYNELPRDLEYGALVKIMHASKLKRFEGDPVRFPQGMKHAIAALKAAGIPNVGVWFPVTGYWNGFDEGEERDAMEPYLVNTQRGLIVAPEREKAAAYFDILCSRVSEWGADFVKIDNQGCHRRYRGIAPIGRSAGALQAAIDSSTEKYFDGALINCMGMPSECMFNRASSAVSRCSDDFMPESRTWFFKNILQCAFNGILQGQYYVNDWDMFWTDDEQATKNSLCRAISGGPIYVSDMPGRTKPEILRPLIYDNGRILRCDGSAKPAADCLTRDPQKSGKPFKVMNTSGEAGLVAAFDLDSENAPVNGSVSPKDAGLEEGKYAYYEYFTRESGILDCGEEIKLKLENNDDFRLYVFIKYEGRPTCFGRIDKMIGVRAVVKEDENGNVALYEGGRIGIVSERPVRVSTDGMPIATEEYGTLTVVETAREQKNIRIE